MVGRRRAVDSGEGYPLYPTDGPRRTAAGKACQKPGPRVGRRVGEGVWGVAETGSATTFVLMMHRERFD